MHGDKDGAVPFEQSIEMFFGLRRAGKQVWLLQYKNAPHSLRNKDAIDFSIRMSQFFDHFLKDKPAPKWMEYKVLDKKIENDYKVMK
jgi:dipeptidyl aminopeptidase/acylaminoacyl peptidase